MEIEVQLGEKEKRFQLPSEDVLFCTHMLEKHNDDYKAMARDKRNMYQLTPKQIRNKIREFKRSKQQYEKYLNDKRHLSKEDVMDTGTTPYTSSRFKSTKTSFKEPERVSLSLTFAILPKQKAFSGSEENNPKFAKFQEFNTADIDH
ncbi:unnamed protein product [Clavelina lepadiformis]|uniref:Nucleolar protein 16 n=1 Tax=Clavelina lepadiformis TaxID=159417 RepID=A0ABP0GC28_CLALP